MLSQYDLIIIGAGPAGLTAALYAGRYRLKALVLEKMSVGGRILLTEMVENFPGFVGGISAQDLMQRMEKQVRELGIEIILDEVKDADTKLKVFKTCEAVYSAQSLIIAVGARARKLGVAGEDNFIGRGVSYCATCDAPFYKNKHVAVIGGGDTVAEEAQYLAKFASSVTIVHRRDQLRASPILQERLEENKIITFALNSIVTGIQGKLKVESITLKDVNTQKERTLNCGGVFIYIGYDPETGFLKNKIKLDEAGFIITDEFMATSQEGVFACGDCRPKSLYQVITACADGAIAAHSAYKYISAKNG